MTGNLTDRMIVCCRDFFDFHSTFGPADAGLGVFFGKDHGVTAAAT
ncbi:MAG: hypothetical protein ABIH24_02700 [Verrucomicrobiota bacterium]